MNNNSEKYKKPLKPILRVRLEIAILAMCLMMDSKKKVEDDFALIV